ncbi:MAG: nuclear transport factor 2 family protein [Candidatus Dadabacteria bacterium]|jgi:ketosteroid isomerase-like protein|nr:nuclear transport factor 2 family protein [Candidatus Dadabacteria bacterium]MCZ6527856.1 nuclear transport factor 2 family protein [Candidatus Dadabacteria bacterium]
MKATVMEDKMENRNIMKELYQYVDDKNINGLESLLAENVHFRLGNFESVRGLKNVLEANTSFFKSIESMKHQIDNIWQEKNDVICNGKVEYIRLDGSKHSITFASILTIIDGKIDNYLVYADVSKL